MNILYKYSQYNIEIGHRENGDTYLFNTYTYHGRWISKADLDDIKDNQSIDLGDVPIYLVKEQYIVPSNLDEKQKKKSYRIKNIDFEVTPYCNENCIHCFNHWRTQTDKNQDIHFNQNVSSEHFCSIAEKIIDIHPQEVLITGGEPLSVFDKIKESIDLFTGHGIRVKVNTNGTFLTAKITEYLSKNNITLFVSLPCSDAESCDKITGLNDSLKKITNSIVLAKQHNVNIAINMVVTKLNIEYIYSTAEYVKNVLGIKQFTATKAMIPCNSNPTMRDICLSYNDFQFMLNELLRVKYELDMEVDSAWEYSLCGFETPEQINQFAFRRKCKAGISHICITNDGDIKPCSVSDKTYGNILSDSISVVMERMKCWRDNSMLPTECLKCKHLKYCGGGCRLDAENTNGKCNSIDSTYNENNIALNYEKYFKQYIRNIVENSITVKDFTITNIKRTIQR